MRKVYNKKGTFNLDTTQDIDFDIELDATMPSLYSIHLWWSGADSNDATLTAYVGDDKDDANSFSQIGSQITINTTNTNLDSEIINYQGLSKAIKIKYSKGGNTTGTGNYRIIGAVE